jgi:hypothetical protein
MPIEQWILTDVCSGRSTKNPAFPRSATGTFQAKSATRNPWSSSGADADCSPRAAAGFFEVESALGWQWSLAVSGLKIGEISGSF